MDFPGKESAYNEGDTGNVDSIPGLGITSEREHGNSFQYSCWRIAWTEEIGMLQFMGLQRVRHT